MPYHNKIFPKATTEESNEAYVHPGPEIRRIILTTEKSITSAAMKLGVGRPCLSSFVSGRTSLSIDLARRLEKIFGIEVDQYLIQQALTHKRQTRVNYQIPDIDQKIVQMELALALAENSGTRRLRLQLAFWNRKRDHLRKEFRP